MASCMIARTMRLRPLVITLAVVLLLVLAAAGGFWWYASGVLGEAIADWRDDWRRQGGIAEFADPPVGGFPLQLTADFAHPVLALPSGETWRGPALAVGKAWLWQLETIRFEAPGHHELDLPAGRLALDAAGLTGAFAFDGGYLHRIALELTEGTLVNRDSGQALSLEALRLAAGPLAPVAGRDYAIDVSFDLAGLPLPPEAEGAALLGPRLDRLRLVGQLRGPLALEAAPRDAAAYWRDGGGVLDLAEIELAWGDLTLEGEGTLTLDEAFRPLGAFAIEATGLLTLVQRLDAAGLLDPAVVPALTAALRALAAGQGHGELDRVKLPVTLQDGLLSLGQIPIGELRPVF